MRRLGVVLAISASLAACGTEGQPRASEAEQNAALYAEFDCLVHAAVGTDDQRSDASTIALAIEPQCERAFQVSFEVTSRGANSAVKRLLYQKMEDGRLQVATSAVLKERSLRGRH